MKWHLRVYKSTDEERKRGIPDQIYVENVCNLFSGNKQTAPETWNEALAFGKVIASAPELVEALRELVRTDTVSENATINECIAARFRARTLLASLEAQTEVDKTG